MINQWLNRMVKGGRFFKTSGDFFPPWISG